MIANDGGTTHLDAAIEAARDGHLAILAGAGLSMLPPSSLPDWWGFNEAFLEEAKAVAFELSSLSDAGRAAIRSLTMQRLHVEAFSDAIVRSFAGEQYFPVLEILDSDVPNANHRALAELAARGELAAVVTTNFDTLIERALNDAGVRHDVYASPGDYAFPPRGRCTVCKIHGSASAAKTLIDTVSQKLRGLSPEVRDRLASIFRVNHVLVVGYSGADLRFGADYLALSALPAGGAGLTWVALPGRPLHEQAARLVQRVGGRVVEGRLPDVFAAFAPGIRLDVGATPLAVDSTALCRPRIRRLLDDMGGGAMYSALFCAQLADNAGQAPAAAALRADIASFLESRGGTVPLTALVAFTSFANAALQAGDPAEGKRWAEKSLALWSTAKERQLAEGIELSEAAARDLERSYVATLSTLAKCRMNLGNFSGAMEAWRRAKRAAAHAGFDDRVSTILLNLALLAAKRGAPADDRLALLRSAQQAAMRNGFAQGLVEAACVESQVRTELGEYDGALRVLEPIELLVPFAGSLLASLTPRLQRAFIALRRGHHDAALAEIEQCIDQAASDPMTEARLRLVAVAELAFHAEFRDRLIMHLDHILDAMGEGRLPLDGRSEHLPAIGDLRQLRVDVHEGNLIGPPTFLSAHAPAPVRELDARRALIAAEYEGDADTAAGVMAHLANLRYDALSPWRMLDLSEAAVALATRGTDPARRTQARYVEAIAKDLAGDLPGAIACSREVIDDDDADPELQIRAGHNLGLVLCRIGRLAEGEPRLERALRHHEVNGHTDELERTRVALGMNRVSPAPDRPLPPPLFSDASFEADAVTIERLRWRAAGDDERRVLAAAAIEAGSTELATTLLLEAIWGFRRRDDLRGHADCLDHLTDIAIQQHRLRHAEELIRSTLVVRQAGDDVGGLAGTFAALGLVRLALGLIDRAESAAAKSLRAGTGREPERFTLLAAWVRAVALRRGGAATASAAHDELAALLQRSVDGSRLRSWIESRVDSAPNDGWGG